MPTFDFVPVKLRALPIDFTMNCEIYSKKTDESEGSECEFALLCESPTITEALINRLKRAIFPKTKVYIDRQAVISRFFDKGHLLGYSEQDVEDIRDNKNPWEKSKEAPPISEFKHTPKGVAPAIYSYDSSLQKAPRLEKVIRQYDEVKTSSTNMITRAKETGKIDKEQSAEISANVQKQVRETDSALIIQAINRIRTVDEYLHTHSLNVAYLNGLIGKWLKFDEKRHSDLVETGLLHDIGKMKLNQEILNKPAKLSPEEFEEIKKHPAFSLKMLMESGVRSKEILEGVVQHHEKLNGTGYPQGIDSNSISDFARITSISDIYDAMVTKRVYKEPHSPFTILNEFMEGAYSELDLRYVDIFINCMAEELRGKEIIVNDGREATIMLVNPRKLLSVIVEIDGKAVTLNDKIYCVKMKET
jgi:HD-GYP domain-containing protein (c-di-GMP phosphodiesterase class II)